MQIDRSELDGLSVLVIMPIRDEVAWPTLVSLMQTQSMMIRHGIPFEVKASVGSTVNVGRSLVVHDALKTEHNRVFMIDADMSWQPEDFFRLVYLSTKMACVGGIYCLRRDPPEFRIDVSQGEIAANEWGCLPFNGFGLGFTIVHRSILEELAADAPKLKFPDRDEPIAHIFTDSITRGEYQGEDMAFFSRVRAKGHGVWVDPSIVLGHVGQKTYTASLLDHIQKIESAIAA